MDLINISVADCSVTNTIVDRDFVSIFFEQVYDIQKEEFIKNIKLQINNWKEFKIKVYISEQPFSKSIEKNLSISEYESFELIQEILAKDNILVLKGFSKDTGCWLEYIFKDYEYSLYQK
jgi:hypothetical protein